MQALTSEVETLRAQLANLKGKSSQPASLVQSVAGLSIPENAILPRAFYHLPSDVLVGETVPIATVDSPEL